MNLIYRSRTVALEISRILPENKFEKSNQKINDARQHFFSFNQVIYALN